MTTHVHHNHNLTPGPNSGVHLNLWGSVHWVRGGDDKVVLSAKVNHRNQLHNGIYVYHFDLTQKKFIFQHEYITKEALSKVNEEIEWMHKLSKERKKKKSERK